LFALQIPEPASVGSAALATAILALQRRTRRAAARG
jgi:hypothetical protein